jgi:hypothetical protein
MKSSGFLIRLIPALLIISASSRASLRIVESTPQRLVVVWSLEGMSVSASPENGRMASWVSFKGANFDIGKAAEPALPGFSFFAGVPVRGAITVTMNSHNVTTVPLTYPLSRRDPRLKTDNPPVFSRPWISDPKYVLLHGYRTAQLIINPFMYDAASNTLRVLQEGSCTIEFPAATAQSFVPASGSDYTAMLKRLVINYDVAQRWAPAGAGLPKRAGTGPHPLGSGPMISFAVSDGDTGFNAGTVKENGLLRIRPSDIAPLGSSIDIRRVRLYASYKGEMPDLTPGLSTMPAGVIEIPLARHDADNDGQFNGSDYLLGYVTGLSDWTFSGSGGNGSYSFALDRYEDYRHYWIVVDDGPGKSMQVSTPSSAASADTLAYFINHVLFTRPVQLPPGGEGGGIDLIWQRLTAGMPRLDFVADLPKIVRTLTGQIRFEGELSGDASIDVAGRTVGAHSGSGSWESISWAGDVSSRIPITVRLNGAGDSHLDLEGVEVRYAQSLDMNGMAGFTVYSPVDTGMVTYRLSSVPADSLYIVRVPLDEEKITLVSADFDDRSHTCTWTDSSGCGIRYYVCVASAFKSFPDSTNFISLSADTGYLVRHLHTERRSNYIIVTHPLFLDAARILAGHKARYATFDNPQPAIVQIQDVYREFSGGNVDPAALRNFLAYAYQVWHNDNYVVLLGNGNYEYKSGKEPVFIPVAEVEKGESEKCVEDYFACLDSGESYNGGPDIFLGRITCNTAREALDIVQKIRETEDPSLADFGAWRNTVLLAADDDMQGILEDGINHVQSSETIAAKIAFQSPATDIRKVYLHEYPWNDVYEKPEAARAIADQINNGVACVNWFGHGADDVWADEHVLTEQNINNLINRGRYPLISSFSCSVGKFDAPNKESLSDRLLKLAHGGAIAAVASTRLAYAQSNTSLAEQFFDSLFSANNPRSIGGAYREAMLHYSSNKQYAFIGDPSIRFVNPRYRVSLTITDETGERIDTIKALQTVTIKGTIVAGDSSGLGTPITSFGTSDRPAWVQVGFYNPMDSAQPKDSKSRPRPRENSTISYLLPGAPIFLGKTQVVSGRFEQTVFIPRNVAFETPGVRLTAFAWQDEFDALGFSGKAYFRGTAPIQTTDSSGPKITIKPVYNDMTRNSEVAFNDRLVLALPAQLEISLFDRNGIDVVGLAPDEGLTIDIPGVLAKQNVNHKFRFNEGDFRSGSAVLGLEAENMKPGTYSLTVSAKDLLGNSSKKTFAMEIVNEEDFSLDHVFNFPNPLHMREGTRFFFYASAPSSPWQSFDGIRTTIRIYTLSGKLIRVLQNDNGTIQNGIFWDGSDQFGNMLGPNVYLYQVSADYTTSQGQRKKSKSAIQKLVIHPPR